MNLNVLKEENKEKPRIVENRNLYIERSLKKGWNICKYAMISKRELTEFREKGDSNAFYIRCLKCGLYYHVYLLTLDKDEVLYFDNIEEVKFEFKNLQKDIIQKVEHYKKLLLKE